MIPKENDPGMTTVCPLGMVGRGHSIQITTPAFRTVWSALGFDLTPAGTIGTAVLLEALEATPVEMMERLRVLTFDGATRLRKRLVTLCQNSGEMVQWY